MALVNYDDIGDNDKNPWRQWSYTGRATLNPEGTTTPEDAALTLADQLLSQGWELSARGVEVGRIGIVRNDDLGSWAVVITYQTEPDPTLAQWISYDVDSPHGRREVGAPRQRAIGLRPQ